MIFFFVLRKHRNVDLPLHHEQFHLLYHIDTMKLNDVLIVYHMLHLVDQVKEKLNQNVIIMLVVIEYFQ
jgi:hypothetical protein